jgi:lipoprotein-anchoring transpeptidase ErfK/SrfK
VPVYSSSTAGPVIERITGQNDMGQTQAFMVVNQSPGWLQVELPIKPNGITGWIQASSVRTRVDPHYLRVSQSQFRLEHYVNGQLQQGFRVAVGAPSTPTPNGHFYVWASQDVAEAPYTPGIFALSSFSPVLENWPGGGRTGIHGWTDASVMGTRASHGCVRVASGDFARLLASVPLGTPVDILP